MVAILFTQIFLRQLHCQMVDIFRVLTKHFNTMHFCAEELLARCDDDEAEIVCSCGTRYLLWKKPDGWISYEVCMDREQSYQDFLNSVILGLKND